MTALAVDSV